MADKVSIIIPSFGRKESLDKCVASIRASTHKNYEILLVTEEGSLAKCRNLGASKASGDYLAFIDDDVEVHPKWIRFIIQSFRNVPNLGGVTGPAIIRKEYRNNRDITKYEKLYNQIFSSGVNEPGRISEYGAISLVGSTDCGYGGEVEYLEACNMIVKKEVFVKMNGFDESYKGVGDWSETDLCFRIRKAGYKLWFDPNVRLYHNPSPNRLNLWKNGEAVSRYSNYCKFSQQWLKQSFKHSIFKLAMKGYLYGSEAIKRLNSSKA